VEARAIPVTAGSLQPLAMLLLAAQDW